jgi:hypothetical protein
MKMQKEELDGDPAMLCISFVEECSSVDLWIICVLLSSVYMHQNY